MLRLTYLLRHHQLPTMINVTTTQSGWRVKLYRLEVEGSWIDQGTGFVECKYIPEIRAPALIVLNEAGDRFLLQSKIQCDDIYERQGGPLYLF